MFRRLAARLPGDLRRCLPTMIAYEICFRTIAAMLGAPLLAWVVGMLVARSGSAAVSNTAIARFLLTPEGLAAAVVLVMAYLVGQLLLTAEFDGDRALALSGRPALGGACDGRGAALEPELVSRRRNPARGARLSFAPFLGLAALTYGFLLTGHDINYYLAAKPPAFLVAVGIGGLLALALLWVVALEYVHGLFVLPILLFEGGSARTAIRLSRARMAGWFWTMGGSVLLWHAVVAIRAR